MAEHRSTAEEAADPATSPERLLELTEKHPQLHRLLVANPSTPDVARQWILATNPWAKKSFEESGAGTTGNAAAANIEEPTRAMPVAPDEDPEDDELEATKAHPVVPGTPAEPPTDEAPAAAAPAAAAAAASDTDEDPDNPTVWGDFSAETFWDEDAKAAPATAPIPVPGRPTGVRLAEDTTVVPLGPSDSPSAAPAASPAPPAAAAPAAGAAAAGSAYGYGSTPSAAPGSSPAPTAAPAAAAAPAVAPIPPALAAPLEDDDSEDGSRRKAWFLCGGCAVLALLLLLLSVLVGRAWLNSGEDESYQRDSTTSSAAEKTPSEEPSEKETEESSEPPVSPAPEDAVEMNELRSPTGNITCLLEEDSVSCSVVERDFSEAGLEDCADGPFTITVAGEEAARACGSSALSDSASTLEYDKSAKRGDMACTSRFNGMTCWNTKTGHGFMVNRATYETF